MPAPPAPQAQTRENHGNGGTPNGTKLTDNNEADCNTSPELKQDMSLCCTGGTAGAQVARNGIGGTVEMQQSHGLPC